MNERIEQEGSRSFAGLVAGEVANARSKHAPMKSLHEGYAVLLEEVDEFWDEVKKKAKDRNPIKLLLELVQVAAMAQRVGEDVLGVPTAPTGVPASYPGTEALRPMDTAPLDGTYILLFGPSGYIGTPLRCEVCRWDPEYRPRNPWQNYANDGFSDTGEPPIGWLPLPVGRVEA